MTENNISRVWETAYATAFALYVWEYSINSNAAYKHAIRVADAAVEALDTGDENDDGIEEDSDPDL